MGERTIELRVAKVEAGLRDDLLCGEQQIFVAETIGSAVKGLD